MKKSFITLGPGSRVYNVPACISDLMVALYLNCGDHEFPGKDKEHFL